jgi:hypothetical protein
LLCLTTLLQLFSKASAISDQLLQLQATRHKKQQVREAQRGETQRHAALVGRETIQEEFIQAITYLRLIAVLWQDAYV